MIFSCAFDISAICRPYWSVTTQDLLGTPWTGTCLFHFFALWNKCPRRWKSGVLLELIVVLLLLSTILPLPIIEQTFWLVMVGKLSSIIVAWILLSWNQYSLCRSILLLHYCMCTHANSYRYVSCGPVVKSKHVGEL